MWKCIAGWRPGTARLKLQQHQGWAGLYNLPGVTHEIVQPLAE